MSRQTVGALVGIAGAQVLTFVLFWLLAEPCDCVARLICGEGTECLWGNTIGEYWATYGTGGSIAAAVLGYAITAE